MLRTVAVCFVSWIVIASCAPAEVPSGKIAETRFWKLGQVDGESVLFVDRGDGVGEASLLFTPDEIVSVQDSALKQTYEAGKDYEWKPGSRTITIPKGSRIVAHKPSEMRRPPKSQKYNLTHRDGGNEIMFGATSEYHDLQTVVTYKYAACDLKFPEPLAGRSLRNTKAKLAGEGKLNIAIFGDSISTGCNASSWANVAPHQPTFQQVVRKTLADTFKADVHLEEMAVGGTATPWGVENIDKVIKAEHAPDLVIIAFGMNDSSGVPAKDYQANIQKMIDKVRAAHPKCEFVLVATMLGNPDWVALKQDLFPQYRDALTELSGKGIALADLTGVWKAMYERKKDWDLTGNGVNHPNDFGHRIYASQILAAIASGIESGSPK